MQNVGLRSLNDYRNAISSLEDSTNIIENQIKSIQDSPSLNLSKQPQTARTAKSHTEVEQKQISTLIESLQRNLHDGNQSTAEKLGKEVSSNLITIADILRRDDYVLDDLESVIQSIPTGSEFDGGRCDALLDTLGYTFPEVIRTRLNRIYFEVFANASYNELTNGRNGDTEHKHSQLVSFRQIDDVKADLRSLYSEIDDVVQLRVNHEYTDQISRTLGQLDESRIQLSQTHTEQAIRQLEVMTQQLDTVAARCEVLHSQRIMQQQLEAYLEGINNTKFRDSGNTTIGSHDKGDGPALAALRQYLSLNHNTNVDNQRDIQIEQAFEEYVSSTERKLDIQMQQKASLEDKNTGTEDTISTRKANETKLAELDAHIAKIKVQIEDLPDLRHM